MPSEGFKRGTIGVQPQARLSMLKRIAPLCLSLTLATLGHAQDADPAQPASPLTSRAVMTSDQVVRILDETVDWYRMLGIQQQSATQPSDLLILYANRQAADRVVALAFELARANAELLSSQAEMEQQEAPETREPHRKRCSETNGIWTRAGPRFRPRSRPRNDRSPERKPRSAARCKRRSRSSKASSTSSTRGGIS